MAGEVPLPFFPIDRDAVKKISAYVQRRASRLKGKTTTVKKSGLIKFEANCYEVFEEGKRQYIKQKI